MPLHFDRSARENRAEDEPEWLMKARGFEDFGNNRRESGVLSGMTPPTSPPGLVTVESRFSPGATMERLESAIRDRGLTLFARIDHSGGAAAAGLPLRFTQLLLFGSPQGGTPLMQSRQTIGIDLPLKMLVWQDEAGDVRIEYDEPAYLAARHGIGDRPAVVAALSKVLRGLAASVTSA